MRNKRVWLRAALLAAVSLTSWLMALGCANRLASQYAGVSVRLAEAAITAKQIRQANEQSASSGLVCSAAWTRGLPILAENAAFGLETKLRILSVYGDMREVAPMKLLCGSFPVEDDTSGCLIDAKSAWKLFHSGDCTGASVSAGNARYTVRGVVETYEPVLLIRNQSAKFENLEFAMPDPLASRQAIETYLYRCGSSAESEMLVENGLAARIVRGAAWIPLYLAAAAVTVWLFFCAWNKRGSARSSLPYWIAGASIAAALVCLLVRTAYWPQSFLPTKWSDFSFWPRLIEGWREQWKALSLATPLPKEIQFFQSIRRIAFLLTVALLSGGWGVSSMRLAAARRRLPS